MKSTTGSQVYHMVVLLVLFASLFPCSAIAAIEEACSEPHDHQAAQTVAHPEGVGTNVDVRVDSGLTWTLERQFGFGGIRSVALSPDGTKALVGGTNAILLDIIGRTQLRVFAGHSGPVIGVAFSPDGLRVLTGSLDRTARLWDVETGAQLQLFLGHSDGLTCVAFSPDGSRVATGSMDRFVRVYDADTGALLGRSTQHCTGSCLSSDHVTALAFSADGARILSGAWDQSARILDGKTGSLLREIFNYGGAGGSINAVAFSPDGTRVLLGGDRGARSLSAESGAYLATYYDIGMGVVTSVAFSPDGDVVMTGTTGMKSLRYWDAVSGQLLHEFGGPGEDIVVFGAEAILTGGANTVRLYDAQSGTAVRALRGYMYRVESVAFSPNGDHLVIAGIGSEGDDPVRLWDAQTGLMLRSLSANTEVVTSVAFSPDGARLVTGSADKTARLWDVESGELLRTLSGHVGKVHSVAFSPNGERVLTGSADQAARLWDAQTGAQLRWFLGDAGDVYTVAFSPDGRRILTGAKGGLITIWDAETGGEFLKPPGSSGSPVYSATFSPNGSHVLSGSGDQTTRLWDARNLLVLREFSQHFGDVTAVAFSPDGTRVLTGEYRFSNNSGLITGVARLLDAGLNEQLAIFAGQMGPVSSVAFSPDGNRVLIGSDDGTAMLWRSAGPASCAVPNLVGQTQAAATAAITAASLTVGTVTPSPSATVPSGLVISTTPAGGASVACNSAVNLEVSGGLWGDINGDGKISPQEMRDVILEFLNGSTSAGVCASLGLGGQAGCQLGLTLVLDVILSYLNQT